MSLIRLSQVDNINTCEFKANDVLSFRALTDVYLTSQHMTSAMLTHILRGQSKHVYKVIDIATLVVPIQLNDLMLVPRGELGSLSRLVSSYYFWVKGMLKHVEGVISCS